MQTAIDVMEREPRLTGTFDAWLSASRRGDRVEYYRGDLAHDRGLGNVPRRRSLEKLQPARDAWLAYERGYVNLVQRRYGPACFAYIAKRRP